MSRRNHRGLREIEYPVNGKPGVYRDVFVGDDPLKGRVHAQADYVRLKGATRLLIHDVGGVEAAGVVLGLGHSHMSRYQSVNSPDFMPLDRVLDLESLDGVHPHVTDALADMNGHILVAKPSVDGDGEWGKHLAAIATETSDVISRVAQALSNDGAITADESKKLNLRAELHDAIRALTKLDKSLEAVERKPKSKKVPT